MKKKLFCVLSLSMALGMSLVKRQASLNFDGINDYVSNTSIPVTGTGSRTIEAWIKTTKNSDQTSAGGRGQSAIVDLGGTGTVQRFTFNVFYGNRLRIEFNGGGVNCDTTTTSPLNDGAWHHVAVVWNSTLSGAARVQFYVDGVAAANQSGSSLTITPNTPTTGTFRIGTRVDGINFFQGSIDDVRVWNYVRTASEIQANMNTEFCGTQTGLVRYYKFNEGTPSAKNTVTAINDYSSNNSTATATNFSLLGTTSNFDAGKTLTQSTIDGTVTLGSSTLTANQAGATYQWYDCTTNTPISGATSQVYSPSALGNYSVMVNLNGCITMSSCTNVTNLSTAEEAMVKTKEMKAYPNPSSGTFYFNMEGNKAPKSISVYDYSGKVVSSAVDFKVNGKEISFNLEAPKGNYIARIIMEDGTSYQSKLIKN